MDGLPKNKKPLRQPDQRDNISLDSYLFERKLQEVYDVKESSNDLPKPLKAIKNALKKKSKKPADVASQKYAKKRKKAQLIDAPYIAPKRQVAAPIVAKKRKKLAIPRVALKIPVRHMTVGVSAVILVGIALVSAPPNKSGVLGEVSDAKPIAQKPDFEVLAPTAQKPAIQSKIKFDATRRVASYIDTLEGANLVINQQKLGETEIKDKEFLRRTALGFNLNKEVTTKKGQAFIGENIDKNTQFAFFIYNDFLFLLKSDRVLKYQSIVEYIDSLQ